MMAGPETPERRSRAAGALRAASGILPRLAEARLRHRDPSVAIREALGDVLAEAAVEIGYQPVVELATGAVVGWEALARGPAGTPLERPDRMFAAARSAGRLEELDWLCQRLALRGALDAGPDHGHVLFLNVEPDATGFMPLELRTLYGRATSQLTVAVEVTERALCERPAPLLGHVADMRAVGCAIALDDVGTEAGSLAMMALLAPEVVKLDLEHLTAQAEAAVAETLDAVGAHVESTGATLLVERIERPEQVDVAVSLSARLGQGWLFGRRAPLEQAPPPPATALVRPQSRPDPRDAAPFALVTSERSPRVGGEPLVESLARELEEQARAAGDQAVLIAAFGEIERFTPELRERYAELAGSVAFCGVVGREMETEPARGVRGGRLAASDPLGHDRTVAVVTPRFAAVLAAHDLGPDAPDDRRLAFVLTHDRELAVGAAAALMSRIVD
jgi:EAL domain-containing protein (putative c-di-GMP-specific phosphodiesterase class I)